jgi:tetratricopeptide (TPR) repeat protein
MSQVAPNYPNRIKACIHAAGYKIREITRDLDIPERTMRSYLAGRTPMPRDYLEAIAHIIGCSVRDLSVGELEKGVDRERDGTTQKEDWGEAPSIGQLYGREEDLITLKRIWNVPYQRNPFFTGREDVLTRLHEMLNREKAVVAIAQHALCGLGGIGKTQTVLEYIYRYESEYQAVFWIKADTRENLFADFLSLAQLLTLPERDAQDQRVATAAIKRWLQERVGWLLVFDNADDLEMVREILPTGCHGHVLLTTRAQAMGGLAQHVEIETMPPEEGALFLLRRAGLIGAQTSLAETPKAYRETALEIVHDLGGLPLALDQAGAYMEESSCHPADYLRLYRQQCAVLLSRRGGLTSDHPEPVTTTWALSFQQVEQADPLAADLLRLCAFLDPDAIPEEILIEGVEAAPLDPLRVNDALAVLLRFSLIRRNVEMRTLTIHRLVQAVLKDQMEEQTRRLLAGNAKQVVNKAIACTINSYSVSGHPRRAIQLLKSSIHLYQEEGDKQGLATNLRNLAAQQQVVGELLASEQSLLECIEVCRGVHDAFSEARAYQSLALLRAYQGTFVEASRYLDTALSLFKQANVLAPESGLWAYRALSALLTKDTTVGLAAAKHARELANVSLAERDIIRAEWLLGWGHVYLAIEDSKDTVTNLDNAEQHLQDALDRCLRIQMVDYEADLLLAWARLYYARGDMKRAWQSAKEALAITSRSDFRVLRADVHNFLVCLALTEGNVQEATSHVQAAWQDALCDGFPYCYQPALDEAKRLLAEIVESRS